MRREVVGGSGGAMVQGMSGHREEFGIYWKPLRTGIHLMISDPSGCSVGRDLQGAAEMPVEKPLQ